MATAWARPSCDTVCQTVDTEIQKGRCHSCQCKEAFDGWLPSPKELRCSVGQEIVVFRSSQKDPKILEPIKTDVETCHNPSLFGGTCKPGSRLGQLSHGDVLFKWLCKREDFNSDFNNSANEFQKVAIIGTNTRTGATCFWESNYIDVPGEHIPSLDQVHTSNEQVAKFTKVFPANEGWACLYCHDNDPFIRSSFLKSVSWQGTKHKFAPYARVMLNGPPQATGLKHLTTPRAKSCTSCHRIASGRTCKGFAQSAFGLEKDSGHERTVIEAMDRVTHHNQQIVHQPGQNWHLAYWMPPNLNPAKTSWDQWHLKFGSAKTAILECCDALALGKNPEACAWKDIPGYHP